MNKLLAFSIGDPGSLTTITLPSGVDKIVNNTNITSDFFATFFSVLLFIGVFMAFGYLLYSGFRFLISQGDKQSIQNARSGIIHSIIGLIVIFTAFMVVYYIGYFFKVSPNIFNIQFQ